MASPTGDIELVPCLTMTDATPDAAPSDAIWTIPNVVSFVRLLAIPVFLWLLLAEDRPAAAGWLLLAIGATDWIDGTLARRLGQVSVLGQRLDPIADRVAIVAAVVGGAIADVVPLVIAVPLLVREVLMTALAFYLFAKRRLVLAVRYLGKMATLLIYGSIPSFYVAAAGVAPSFFRPLGWISGSIGLVLYWWVAIDYLGDARSKLQQLITDAR